MGWDNDRPYIPRLLRLQLPPPIWQILGRLTEGVVWKQLPSEWLGEHRMKGLEK